jgi:hypothetical protein
MLVRFAATFNPLKTLVVVVAVAPVVADQRPILHHSNLCVKVQPRGANPTVTVVLVFNVRQKLLVEQVIAQAQEQDHEPVLLALELVGLLEELELVTNSTKHPTKACWGKDSEATVDLSCGGLGVLRSYP